MAFDAGAIKGTMALNAKGWFSKITKVGKSVTGLKGKMKGLGAGIVSLGKTMTLTGALIGAGLLGLAAKAAAFEGRLHDVATLGVKDLDALREGVKEVTVEFGGELQANVETLYNTISAGVPEDAAIMVMGEAARAAKAGVGELSSAVDLGTSLVNAYGRSWDDFNEVMGEAVTAVKFGKTTIDDLGGSVGRAASLMAKAGISSGEYLAVIAGLTTTGSAAAEQVSALKQTVSNIIKPTESATTEADRLGVKFDAAALKAQGLIGFLDGLKTSLDRLQTPVEQRREALKKEIEELGKAADSNRKVGGRIRDLKREYKELARGGSDRRKESLEDEIRAMERHGTRTLEGRRELRALKDEYRALSNQGVAGRLAQIDQEVTKLEALRGSNVGIKEKMSELKAEYASLSEAGVKQRIRAIDKEVGKIQESKKQTEEQRQKLVELRQEKAFLTAEENNLVNVMGRLFESTEALNVTLAVMGDQGSIIKEALGEMTRGTENLTEAYEANVKENPAAAWAKLKAESAVLAVTMGEELVPALGELLKAATPVIKEVRAWIKENPELAAGLTKAAIGLTAISVTLGPMLIALGTLVPVLLKTRKAFLGLKVIGGLGKPISLVGAKWGTLMGQFGLFLGAIGVGTLIGFWIDDMINKHLPGLAAGIDLVSDKLVGLIDKLKEWIGLSPALTEEDYLRGTRSRELIEAGRVKAPGEWDDVRAPVGGGEGASSMMGGMAPAMAGATAGGGGGVTINVYQQAGEDGMALARRVEELLAKRTRLGKDRAGARLGEV